MKISFEWLNEFVSIPCSPAELGDKLTHIGLETEGIETSGGEAKNVVVGEILEIQKHPQADRLTVCRVNNGKEELQIVCGAKNMKVGDKVPVALVGAKLPNGLDIKKSKLRGVESHGMMCSAKELHLPEEEDGLLILPQDFPIGKPFQELLPLQDTILEINVTPNRGDCLSHLGIAREVAALFKKKVRLPEIKFKEEKEAASQSVKIKIDSKDCPRYTARVIQDVTLKPSPLWMKLRLTRCGIRPINNIVDITNYVMLELGQPMHAFDMAQIKGDISIRQAKPNEAIVTLDEKKHSLGKDFLVIADSQKPIALAGVMGGKDSEVSEKTKDLLLESAFFSPARVRQMRRMTGVPSESSYRFERGVDIAKVELASQRAAQLFQNYGGGKILKGVVDIGSKSIKPKKISLRTSQISKLLGFSIPEKSIESILQALGIPLTSKKKGIFEAEIPTYRHDLLREVDLIEEIVRIYGYEKIPMTRPISNVSPFNWSPQQALKRELTDLATGLGFQQVLTYSFTSKRDLEPFFSTQSNWESLILTLKNPISDDLKIMRPRLLPTLLRAAHHNLVRGCKEIRFFEVASTYHPLKKEGGKSIQEREVFTLLMSQPEAKVNWSNNNTKYDFYNIKGISELILNSLHLGKLELKPLEESVYHPGQSGSWLHNGEIIANVGQLHPLLLKHFDIDGSFFALEIFLDQIPFMKPKTSKLRPFSRYPKISRDIALVVDQSIPEQGVRQVFEQIHSPLLESFNLFDTYIGPQITKGKKSLAYSLHYRNQSATLTDTEVDEEHAKICQFLKDKLNCEFRS